MTGKTDQEISQDADRLLAAIDEAIGFLDEKQYYPRGNVYLDKVAFACISKALVLGRAVCVLVKAGFGEEAFGLSRTLVDLALSLRYMANRDSERRAKRFVDFYGKIMKEWLRRLKKHYPQQVLKPPRQHKEFLKRARKFKNPYSWIGRGGQAKLMALEPDRFERDSFGVPHRWEFDYDWIYFWTSQYVHVTALALNSHAVEPREAFKVHIRRSSERHTGELALFNAAIYIYKIFILGFRALKDTVPDGAGKSLQAFIEREANETLKPTTS